MPAQSCDLCYMCAMNKTSYKINDHTEIILLHLFFLGHIKAIIMPAMRISVMLSTNDAYKCYAFVINRCIVNATKICLQDKLAFQITRDAVASALNEYKIDVSGTPLCNKCNEVDLFSILKDHDFAKRFPAGVMPCGEDHFPVKLPPDGDALNMAKKHEIYKSVNSDLFVNGLSYFMKHSCPMGENVMIYIWCSAMEEFVLHALTILSRIPHIQKKQSNMYLCFHFEGPTKSDVRRYLCPILGDIYTSDAFLDVKCCIFEGKIPDRFRV